jgi:hypothetical protein
MTTFQTILLSLLLLIGIAVLPLLHDHPTRILNDNTCPVSIIENVISGSSAAVLMNEVFSTLHFEFLFLFVTPTFKTSAKSFTFLNRAPPIL